MFKVYYWIAPANAKKYHIHAGDGRSLCGSWLMTNKDQMVKDGDVQSKDDCVICFNKMIDQKGEEDE